MATIVIKSNNPDISYVLCKNPNGMPLVKSIRDGIGVGWYSDDTTYCINFRDGKRTISFKEYEGQQHEYLTYTSYNSPFAYLSLLNEFLRVNSTHKDDVSGYEYEMYFSCVSIKGKMWLGMLISFIKDATVELGEVSVGNYSVRVKSTLGFNVLLSISQFIIFMVSVRNGDDMYIDVNLKRKYINLMRKLRVPYSVRNIFKSNLLVEGSGQLIKELQEDCDDVLLLQPGNSNSSRMSFVMGNRWLCERDVVDIGCGEGKYSFKIAGRTERTVHAVDIDEDAIAYVSTKAKNAKYGNVVTYDSVESCVDNMSTEFDVLVVEVIEHMEYDDAVDMVRRLTSNNLVNKIILTTPNRMFNVYYGMVDGEMRHDDHKFELSPGEFDDFIKSVRGDMNFSHHGVGDKVNEEYTTLGCILYR